MIQISLCHGFHVYQVKAVFDMYAKLQVQSVGNSSSIIGAHVATGPLRPVPRTWLQVSDCTDKLAPLRPDITLIAVPLGPRISNPKCHRPRPLLLRTRGRLTTPGHKEEIGSRQNSRRRSRLQRLNQTGKRRGEQCV